MKRYILYLLCLGGGLSCAKENLQLLSLSSDFPPFRSKWEVVTKLGAQPNVKSLKNGLKATSTLEVTLMSKNNFTVLDQGKRSRMIYYMKGDSLFFTVFHHNRRVWITSDSDGVGCTNLVEGFPLLKLSSILPRASTVTKKVEGDTLVFQGNSGGLIIFKATFATQPKVRLTKLNIFSTTNPRIIEEEISSEYGDSETIVPKLTNWIVRDNAGKIIKEVASTLLETDTISDIPAHFVLPKGFFVTDKTGDKPRKFKSDDLLR